MADPQQTPKSFIPDEAPSAPRSFTPDAQPPKPQRSTAADVGIGAGKGALRDVMDYGTAALMSPLSIAMNPANLFLGNLTRKLTGLAKQKIEPENTAQTVGSYLPGVAAAAIPGALGGRLAQRGAEALEMSAVPGLTRTGARQLAERGAERITASNAAALAKEAARTPVESATQVMRGGRWVPKSVGPSRLQPAADAMKQAVATPSAPVSWPEMAALTGGGYYLFGPKAAAALGAARLLNRPAVKATGAHVMNATAPALNAATYGVGGGIVEALTRLLGGGQ